MESRIDPVLSALAHPVRRDIVERLLNGSCAVKELAEPYDMTPGAISQHLGILERAHLINRELKGRRHICRLDKSGMQPALDWFRAQEAFWNEQLDSLQAFVESPSFQEANESDE